MQSIAETLARLMYNNLKTVGGVMYSPLKWNSPKNSSSRSPSRLRISLGTIVPALQDRRLFPANTDVGDITWVVPTAGLGVATWVLAHQPSGRQ